MSDGRLAEVYQRDPQEPTRLTWIGYTADEPPGAVWSTEHAAWIVDDHLRPKEG